ncbi:MAG: nitronate monooxygenase family protein [Candidatus Omnitrophica bacterium]|jgi:NAD(P)H-dependent flavin oxidoreductase YrpB (nitropropane dioxygenase family)|nr:nitronate monooxygenase family protein [Candidatus Omnitrophota bacterium]
MSGKLESLIIGDLKIKLPIIQGGMGVRVSASSLASAVSNQGALGVIAAVGLGEEDNDNGLNYAQRSTQSFIDTIRQARSLTSNPIGVNVMCALTNYDNLVSAAQDEGIDVIISGAGLPLGLPALIKNKRTKLFPIVSSGRAANIICSTWKRRYARLPDAIVVEGPLAGGHLGYSREELKDPEHFSLENILKDVLEVAGKYTPRIPVVAAGGIYTGADIAKMLKIGASAVQMATRFVCTNECDASLEYKKLYLSSKKEDIVVINSPVGMPGRVIRNKFVERIESGEKIDFQCFYKCLITCDPRKVNYCIAKALVNAYRGDLEHGFAMCGTNAYRIDKIVSVKELIDQLVSQAQEAL